MTHTAKVWHKTILIIFDKPILYLLTLKNNPPPMTHFKGWVINILLNQIFLKFLKTCSGAFWASYRRSSTSTSGGSWCWSEYSLMGERTARAAVDFLVIIGEEGDGGVESGERIVLKEIGEIGRGKSWRGVRGTGIEEGEPLWEEGGEESSDFAGEEGVELGARIV